MLVKMREWPSKTCVSLGSLIPEPPPTSVNGMIRAAWHLHSSSQDTRGRKRHDACRMKTCASDSRELGPNTIERKGSHVGGEKVELPKAEGQPLESMPTP